MWEKGLFHEDISEGRYRSSEKEEEE